MVTSVVDLWSIRVTLLVPLSLSSKNSRKPALVAPFFNCIPALNIGVVSVGVVSVLFVKVSVVSVPTKVVDAFGSRTVLSPVGSTTLRVVSLSSAC